VHFRAKDGSVKSKSSFSRNRVPGSKHLDFGCGSTPRNPFDCEIVETLDLVGAGIVSSVEIENGMPIPFPDDYFDSISAYDVLEHISRNDLGKNLFIFYMNEFSRVLKVNGHGLFIFPEWNTPDAFSDPTHVNYITKETLNYFIGVNSNGGYAGITTNFDVLINSNLRLWKKWVYQAEMNKNSQKESLRRRISLFKRTIKRVLMPQHRIWLVRKVQQLSL